MEEFPLYFLQTPYESARQPLPFALISHAKRQLHTFPPVTIMHDRFVHLPSTFVVIIPHKLRREVGVVHSHTPILELVGRDVVELLRLVNFRVLITTEWPLFKILCHLNFDQALQAVDENNGPQQCGELSVSGYPSQFILDTILSKNVSIPLRELSWKFAIAGMEWNICHAVNRMWIMTRRLCDAAVLAKLHYTSKWSLLRCVTTPETS